MEIIKSTKTSLLAANTNKLDKLYSFIDEYCNVVSTFIDILWLMDKIPDLMRKDITNRISSWISARAIQCAGKQASGIVRGVKRKQEKRLFIINRLIEEGKFKKARKLQRIYDETLISKPVIEDIEPKLDSRFVDINFNEKNITGSHFDGWVVLSSLVSKKREKIIIPFKKHKHFNKMLSIGKIKEGIQLSKKNITFTFDVENKNLMKKVINNETKRIGIDVGQKTTLFCSDGQNIDFDQHGHNYQTICNKLARKNKGSKAFRKAQKHRTNYLHWCVNQLDFTGIGNVNLEDIKHLRKGNKRSRALGHWNYAELFDVLEAKLVDAGVQITKMSPTYTSQRCSCCGWVCKSNRKGKLFECGGCGFICDSDSNGSKNIALYLRPIGTKERLLHKNKTGFYWLEVGQEHIVPATQRSKKKNE